jgi:uncharacterized protein (TIGR03435 family)
MRLVTGIALLAFSGATVFGQTDNTSGSFEVASIKPTPLDASIAMSGCYGGPNSDDPGRIRCEYTTLRMLLQKAYGVKSNQVLGPTWLDSAHFNIVAKLPQATTSDQIPAMFRALLADRFQLTMHRESRLLQGYSLTLAKSGIKVKGSVQAPSAAAENARSEDRRVSVGEDGFPILRPAALAKGPVILFRIGQARLQASNCTMTTLAGALSNYLDSAVIDETGLPGRYEMTLYWAPDAGQIGWLPPQSGDSGPSQGASAAEANLFVAVQQQLGLQLVSKKIPGDVLVIDHIEQTPSEN